MLLNGYYFRGHMYTLVPRHLREDMTWMADCGNQVVSIGILEQDFDAARWNLDFACREAERAGLSVYAVPSRWGGLVAGSLKVPSMFTATHPETWILKADGSPRYGKSWGPMSSVHHPATFDFFCSRLEALITQFPIKGVIWDEPKALDIADHSPAARTQLGADALLSAHTQAAANFFDRCGQFARSLRADLRLGMFLYASLPQPIVACCAAIAALDDFGCDGRPWRVTDDGATEAEGKALIGQSERFITAAQENGKQALLLIENHNLTSAHFTLMDQRLPEVLALDADHLIYYYYPRDVDQPDEAMAIVRKHLQAALQ